jgi:superfamily II DNA helicase RecQ
MQISVKLLSGEHCVLKAGTGAGKTMGIIIPRALLALGENGFALTISPLKALMKAQVCHE